ncbi:YpmA family protein [Fodinisporobacter ferrooxydans]|uniref:YpmA family protein n=1 Tax=Fodinisporobacter ferrooxydans TaxID=2901836 RepID=A0ABY4CGN0_9BACL|nr:YpmA family protein [Alicyclobacillaceae bacterium MYW30-H2]
MPGQLEIIATKKVTATDDLYQLIDFLNRNLKDRDVVFGLSKSDEANKLVVTIYRTE